MVGPSQYRQSLTIFNLPIEIKAHILKETVASEITPNHLDWWQLAALERVNKNFRSFVKARPEHRFKYMQPMLSSIAKDCIKNDMWFWDRSHCWNPFLTDTLVPAFAPSLFGLIVPKKRAELVALATNIKDKTNKFILLRRLEKERAYLGQCERQRLAEASKDLNADEIISATRHNEETADLIFSYKIRALVSAVLTELNPNPCHLQHLFNEAKKIPRDAITPALEGLFHARRFLPEKERRDLFNLMMEVGAAEDQQTNMPCWHMTLFNIILENTKGLDDKELLTFIDAIKNYKSNYGAKELLCCLARAAGYLDVEHLDERLRDGLIEALGEYSSVLKVAELSPKEFRKFFYASVIYVTPKHRPICWAYWVAK
jgi:hypothetical protein